jgi:hypothetical protein
MRQINQVVVTMSSHPTRGSRRPQPKVPQAIVTEAQHAGLTPLDYMLSIVRDPTADPARRDRMAIAAAQYMHPRAVYSRQTKKAAAAAAAKQVGGEWGDDLAGDWPQ